MATDIFVQTPGAPSQQNHNPYSVDVRQSCRMLSSGQSAMEHSRTSATLTPGCVVDSEWRAAPCMSRRTPRQLILHLRNGGVESSTAAPLQHSARLGASACHILTIPAAASGAPALLPQRCFKPLLVRLGRDSTSRGWSFLHLIYAIRWRALGCVN